MKRLAASTWVPLALLAGGLIASGLLAHHQHQVNRVEQAEATQTEAQRTVDRSVAQLERTVLGLRGARGYLLGAGTGQVTAQGFAAYMATRNLASEFPGVLGHGFIRRVAPTDEARYLAGARARVAPDFAIGSLQAHSGERRIIELIEPLAPNRGARGLDIASEAQRRLASDQALQGQDPVLTGPIRLVQSKPGSSLGLLMLLATAAPAGPGAQAPAGFVYAPIQLDELLASAGLRHDLVELRVDDVTPGGPIQDFVLPADGPPALAGAPGVTLDRQIMQRTWRFTVHPRPALVQALRQVKPMEFFLEGLLGTLLLAALSRLWLVMHQRQADALAERVRLRSLLDNAGDAIIGLDTKGKVMLWNQAATQLFGYTATEAVQRSLTELTLDATHAEEGGRLFQAAQAGQATGPFETARRARDGSEVEVELSISPIYDADGRLAGVAKVLRPIHDRLDRVRQLKAYGEELELQVRERTALVEASRRDLRSVLDAMPSLVGAWDTQLRNRFANATYAAYFGKNPDEILHMSLPELLGPDLFARNEPFVRRALAGEEQIFERDLPLANGQGMHHTLAHYLPHRENGQVVGFYVLVHDITAVKQAQQRLRDSEAMLTRTERVAQVGGWSLDAATQALSWSEGTCLIHGLPPGHQPSVAEAITYYQPPHRQAIEQAVQRSLAQGDPWDLEVQMQRADGQAIWVRARGEAEWRDGRVVRLSGSIQDITQQIKARQDIEQARRLLQAAIDTVDEAFVLFDPQDRLVLCNDKYRRLYAQSADLIVPGASFEAIIRGGVARGQYAIPAGREEAWIQDRLALHRQASTSMLQELPNGRVLRIAERHLPDGHTVGFRFDVTELVQARRSAEASSRAKSDFLANTSHEIRTPLNAIIGLSHLLERESLPPEPLGEVRRIGQAARALLAIVNDVLDLSKIEAGQLVLDEVSFDLLALVQEELGLHRASASPKGLELLLEFDPDQGRRVRGDPGRLRQILSNLLSNAVKFTPAGSVHLVVRQGVRTPLVVFEVRDTGIGIAAEDQQRLFQPFEQADASTSRRFGGTGLGLSISAQLAGLMGGTLGLYSEAGRGSCFSLCVPLHPVDPAQAARATDQATPIRVLLALADPGQRDALTGLMRSLGWQCQTVDRSQALLAEAREALGRGEPVDVLAVAGPLQAGDELTAVVEWLQALPAAARPLLLRLGQPPLPSVPDAAALFNAVNAHMQGQAQHGQRLCHPHVPAADALVWLPGVCVLVVDDSSINLEVARKLLAREGAQVLTASSGPEALDRISRHREIDAVLLDVQMPGMDGVQVAQRLRRDAASATLPVIALTAGALREERDRALAAGMDDFWTKPLNPMQMIASLRDQVERHTGRPIPVALRPASTAMATREAAWIVGIDPDALTPAVRDDRPLHLSMLRRLLAEFSTVADEPVEELPARMHKLRGGAYVLGATALADAAGRIEQACQGGDAGSLLLARANLRSALQQLHQAAQPALAAEDARLAATHADRVAQSSTSEALSPEALAELRRLVDDQSARARTQATEQAPALMATLGPDRVTRLLSALEAFDFERAAQELADPPAA